jgi:hypothetical protein
MYLLRTKKNLKTDVCDPIRFAVQARHGLNRAASHEEQAQVAPMIEGLASADIQCKFAMLGRATDLIGVLQIV